MGIIKSIESILGVELVEVDDNSGEIKILGSSYSVEGEKEINFEMLNSIIDIFGKERDVMISKAALENFIMDILEFDFKNIDFLLERSSILGINFSIKRYAVLIEVENIYLVVKDKSEMALQKFKDEFCNYVNKVLENSEDIVTYIGNNRFLICKSEEEGVYKKLNSLLSGLKDMWDLEYKISIGDSYDMPGIEAISYSYKDSVNYMVAGKRMISRSNIYTFDNVGLYLIYENLSDFQKSKILKYVKEVIRYGKKSGIDIKLFLETLFENNCVLSKTERDLEMSSGKAKKIVDTIHKISGLNATVFEDAVKFYIALKLWRD